MKNVSASDKDVALQICAQKGKFIELHCIQFAFTSNCNHIIFQDTKISPNY